VERLGTFAHELGDNERHFLIRILARAGAVSIDRAMASSDSSCACGHSCCSPPARRRAGSLDPQPMPGEADDRTHPHED